MKIGKARIGTATVETENGSEHIIIPTLAVFRSKDKNYNVYGIGIMWWKWGFYLIIDKEK